MKMNEEDPNSRVRLDEAGGQHFIASFLGGPQLTMQCKSLASRKKMN